MYGGLVIADSPLVASRLSSQLKRHWRVVRAGVHGCERVCTRSSRLVHELLRYGFRSVAAFIVSSG